MKIAPKTRLSLRKLFTAMLAVGPLAVLPSPLWAVLPTASSFTVTNGTATLSTSGSTVNINFSDKTILTWGTTAGTVAAPNRGVTDGSTITNFIVDSTDTWNFASAGAVLNKVSAGANIVVGGVAGLQIPATTIPAVSGAAVPVAGNAAIINGALLGSNAKVFVLANGGIVIGNGAQLNTQSLILSTLGGENDGTFITLGDLTFAGTPTTGGSITIGTITGGGSLTAVGSTVSMAGGSVGGDLVLKAVTAGSGVTLSSAVATTVGGNLTVTTNSGPISQGGGFGLTVGALTAGSQTATLNSGTATIILADNTNDFERVVANTSGLTGNVTVRDANIVTLGASSIGGDLTMKVGGKASTTAIETDGTVVIGGNASFEAISATSSNVTIANNSSVAGAVSAQTAGGSVNLTLAGNLTLGIVKTDNVAKTMTGVVYAGLSSAPTVLVPVPVTTDPVAKTVTSVTLTAGTTDPIYRGNITTGDGLTISSPIATATPKLQVSTINITDGGSGYTPLSTVALTFPTATGGTKAVGVANTDASGTVTSITITTVGNYIGAFPTATIDKPASGTQAKLQTVATLNGINVATAGDGSGYTAGVATPVTIVGGGVIGAPATASVATVAGDSITGYTLLTGGLYTAVPSVVVTHPNANAVPAEATAVRDSTTNLVTSVAITNAGLGYGVTPPVVTFPTVDVANNFSVGNITANVTGTVTNTGALQSGNRTTLRGSVVITGATIKTATGNKQASAVFTSNSGDITLGAAAITANRVTADAKGNITLLAGGDLITSGRAQDANSFTATGNVSLDAAALNIKADQQNNFTAQNASIRSINNLTLGNTSVTGNVSLRAGSFTTNGGNKTITLGRALGSDATPIIVGGAITATTDGSGGIFQNIDSRIEVFGGMNLQTGYNNALGLIVGGNIVLDAASIPGALTPSVRFGLVNASTGTAGGAVTLAENTTLNLGTITGSSLTASSTTGGIIDSGAISIAAGGTAAFTVTGTNNVVIDNATNVIPAISVTGGKDNSFTALNGAVLLSSTTNAAGNTTIGTNNLFPVSLGNVVTTGNVVVNSGSYIDVAGNVNIAGDLTLNATGVVTNAGTFSSVYAGNVSINNTTGRANTANASNLQLLSYVTAPTVTVVGGAEPTTPATAPTVTVAGGIVTLTTAAASGAGYTIAPTVTLSAPTTPGAITATATATIAGGMVTGYVMTNSGSGYTLAPIVTMVGGGDPTTVATITPNLGTTGQLANFTVTNNGSTGGIPNGGVDPYVSSKPYRVDIAGPTTTSILESNGQLVVGGTTSISAPGQTLLFRANDFANVVLNNTTGGVLINDVNNVTVSGNSLGNVDVTAGSAGSGTAIVGSPFTEAAPWNVTLGNIAVNSMNVTAKNGGAGVSGTITQSKNATVYSYGPASFTTSNATITLGNNGNNFGRIAASNSAESSTITIVEDGTMKIGNITTKGNTTLTSRFGGIIEDPAADVVIRNEKTLTATAVNGSILIGNTTHTVGTTTGNVVTFNATAGGGQVAITSNNSTTLGNIDANSLVVEVTGGNGNIAQSGIAKVFGSATFSAGVPATAIGPAKGGNITLTDNANNFGRIFLTTIGPAANIAISEGATMNLGKVTMPANSTGSFTATSVTGDIIDTGLGGVRPGGTLVVGGTGTGAITLSAVAGDITLDDPTTDFPSTGGVVFTSKNVTLSPLGGATLFLGSAGQTAVATGNLTVTSATGSIFNAGPVNVTGDAFFQSGSGDILMTNASNNFGTVKFAGKIVSITEAGHLTLATGSSATGAATFTTAGGNIDIVNRGGTISLASTGLFNASGSITLPKLIQVSDTLTVSAAGTKDLSKLSTSGDLGGKAVQNFGTGTYLPPLP